MDPRLEAEWRERVARVLKGASFDVLVSRSADGIAIEPLHAAADDSGMRAFRQDAARPWRIVQRVDHPDPVSANALALTDLQGGADGLGIVFAGAPSAYGFGLRAAGGEGLARALEGVEIDLISLTLDHAPFEYEAGISAVLDLLRARRLEPEAVDIGFGLDPVGAMAFSGRAPDDCVKKAGSLARGLFDRGFRSPSMRADGAIHHAAGASEAQELAATIATGVLYLRALEASGLGLHDARRRVAFRLAADQDEFLAIAKFRALRRLWAEIERACGLDPLPIRLEGQTAFRMLTASDTETNLLRNTLAAFSAAIGGADAIAILPHSAAVGLPDGFARRLARNSQAILIEECRLAAVSDPAAGSGAFEALTDDLANRAFAIFQETERAGGLFAMLESGAWEARVASSRQRRVSETAAGRRPILGVTMFPPKAARAASILMPAPLGTTPEPDVSRLLPWRDALESERSQGWEDRS